jgi:anti-sigma factor RsiW
MTDDDDMLLVAYLDGALDTADAEALAARLAGDAALRQRLEHLRQGGAGIAEAFAALAAEAPVARMTARLEAARTPQKMPAWRWPALRIAASIALVAFGIGIGHVTTRLAVPPAEQRASGEREGDWRAAIAGYVSLYSRDTFAVLGAGARPDAGTLADIQRRIGMALPVDAVALPEADYRGTQMLAYDNAALVQIAYVDRAGDPLLFCILAGQGADEALKSQSFGPLAAASWVKGGRGFMVIGHLPSPEITAMAETLKQRI